MGRRIPIHRRIGPRYPIAMVVGGGGYGPSDEWLRFEMVAKNRSAPLRAISYQCLHNLASVAASSSDRGLLGAFREWIERKIKSRKTCIRLKRIRRIPRQTSKRISRAFVLTHWSSHRLSIVNTSSTLYSLP